MKIDHQTYTFLPELALTLARIQEKSDHAILNGAGKILGPCLFQTMYYLPRDNGEWRILFVFNKEFWRCLTTYSKTEDETENIIALSRETTNIQNDKKREENLQKHITDMRLHPKDEAQVTWHEKIIVIKPEITTTFSFRVLRG